jgi:hypothetical protein
MNGKINCMVGETGSGKTTRIKKYSQKAGDRETLIYLRMKDDFTGKNIKKFTNFPLFLKAANKKKDAIILIDEAFTCLPKKLNIRMDKPEKIDNQLADFLVNARKFNNLVFINFHALQQVPTEWLIPYLDYFFRFTTNDLLQYQIQRFKSFPNIANNLRDFPKVEKYKPYILKLR